MEFVALGVLGMMGYMSAKKPTKPLKTPPKKVHFKDLEDDFRRNVKDHMESDTTIVPGLSTVSNHRPFFTSEKSQNTNDDFKDRRLGTFTGINNIDYQQKQEVQAAAPVKNLSNIHGATYQPDMERYKQYTANCRNHNVNPVEKQYVGPGLGIDPSVAADGGFHQEFRILPDNVNGYRKNTFGGEIIHGKSVINQRESEAFTNTRDLLGSNLTAEEQANLGNRPLEAPHGSTSAHSVRYDAKASLNPNNNRSMEGVCNPGTLTGAVDATYQFGDATRQDDRTFACNVTGGAFRGFNGGYNDAQYFTTETERETANNQRTNVHGNQFASYIYGQTDTHTLRENEACPSQQYGGAHSSSSSAATSRSDAYARPTQKEQLNSEFFGISGSGVSNAHTVVDDKLNRSTMRGGDTNRYQTGPASAHVSGFTKYYEETNPNASRELATMTNYTYNGQKPNLMLGAQQMANTVTSQRQDDNDNRVCSNPKGLGVQNYTNSQHIGSLYAYGQQTIENNRDFGYAPQNALVTNILKK